MERLKKLNKWIIPYLWVLGIILTTVLLSNVSYSYIPIMISYIFDLLNKTNSSTSLPNWLTSIYAVTGTSSSEILKSVLYVVFSIIALQLIRQIINIISNISRAYLSETISNKMKINMYNHISDLSFTYHKNSNVGDLIQRCTSDITTTTRFLANQLPQIFSIIVYLVVGCFQMSSIRSELMFVNLAFIPVSLGLSLVYYRYVSKNYEDIELTESKMTTIIQENVNGVRVVKAFANERFELKKMDAVSKQFRDKRIKFNSKMAMFWGVSDGLASLQYAVTLLVGIVLSKRGLIDTSDMVSAALLTGILVYPIRGLGRIISDFGQTLVASERIDQILTLPSEYEINGTKRPVIKGNIEFKDVSFKFDDADINLLNRVSFKIEKGSTVAIVGKTGSGKSTIVSLLTRMIEISSGDIIVDGVSIKDIDKKYLRSQINYVLQEPFLYSKTLYENIAISLKEKSKDREKIVMNSSKVAALHDEAMNFEKGYETVVGERGATLSGGQRQRVAIARALVNDSPVIIFDDSLSALDTKTDSEVRYQMSKLENKKTTILITHRTTTAKDADLIVVIDKGSVVDLGTHEELISRQGFYNELWNIQGALFDEFNDSDLGGDK